MCSLDVETCKRTILRWLVFYILMSARLVFNSLAVPVSWFLPRSCPSLRLFYFPNFNLHPDFWAIKSRVLDPTSQPSS
ncbi:hypothetical protein B0H12DRAFT_334473 [Mycena haematopus]|nr:hypothetical protein B0H12DRAFT_334473 [Mycena haematopus]